MTLSWRARLHRLRVALLVGGATVVIVLGVLAGLTQLAMPWLADHPQHVERWLSARLDRPVTIRHLSGSWVGGGPLLVLDDVHIAAQRPGQRALRIPHAELAFDLYALFKRNSALTEFRVSGLDLRLVNEAGGWRLHGLDLEPAQESSEPFSLGALGALEISQLTLTVEDAQRELRVALDVPVLRLLNRGAVTRVLGRVRLAGAASPLLDLVADLDPATRSGEVYFGGTDVELAQFAGQSIPGGIGVDGGRGAVQVWVRVQAGQAEDVRARVALDDVRLQAKAGIPVDPATKVAPRVAFARLAFVARWLRDAQGWTLDLGDFLAGEASDAPAQLTVERRGDVDQPRWRAAASALALEPLGSLAMLAGDLPEGLRRWVYLAHPRGTLAQAGLVWRAADEYDVDARLRGIELASAGVAPGVSIIDLDLRGDAQALLLQLPEQALRVDYPHVFRRPFTFAQFGGDVVAWRADDTWRVATERIDFEGEGFGGQLRGRVDLPADGARPFVDLYALVTHADVVAAKRFWPTITMPPTAIAWLDRALVGGEVVGGRAALRGDLADWPFHRLGGRMIARAEIADLTLDYDPAWPRAEKISAVATFINDGMHVDVEAAETKGNRIVGASAAIADFGPLVLELAARGEGSGAHLLDFLRATPIGKRYQDRLKGLAVGGSGKVAFTLTLPIHQTDALSLDGSVDLAAAKLDHNDYDLHFTDASGKLAFNQKGFSAGPLDVGFRGSRAQLALAIGAAVADPRHVFEASLNGRFPVSTVFADVPVLLPMLAEVSGESAWTARVAVDAAQDGAAARTALSLDSDLVGIAIGLPAPLAKNAASAAPFHLDLPLPYAGQHFSVRLGDLAVAEGRLPGPNHAFAARIDFGSAAAGELPAQGIAINGHVTHLDGGGWLDRVSRGGSGAGSLVHRIELQIDDLQLAQRHFDAMHLAIDTTAQATTLRLDGAALAGRLDIPGAADAGRGITAKFARVHWPDPPPSATDSPALTDVAPASLPALHVAIEDFRLGSASFGSAVLESRPVAGGMRIDQLQTHSPNITMTASGDWTGSAQGSHSRMAIALSAQNLGHMMAALGFPGLIDGGATKATIDAGWPGPPSAFALPKLDGSLDIQVAEGRIPEVEPGAGRLFGLLSLSEIPRRLSLDFSDFFKSGLSFNSIRGKFRLADGNAYTDGVTIKSPAADIVVRGRTGLRAKDYDQQMEVTAHAGATLPLVGALAAGPVGAAAGLVVQGILNKPIGMAIAKRYSVTGSWDKPKVTPEKAASREPGSGNRPP